VDEREDFCMSGHSKWANIKRQKEKSDARKGKVFSRASKEIINAVKHGSSSDPKTNARLRLAIQKAKEVNFPSENIDRVIKKASSSDQEAYHEMQYELYGHGAVGIILDVMTDNKNRISSDVRIATNKRGGCVTVPGAVAFNFDRKGVILISKKHALEEELFAAVIEAGAEDFVAEEEDYLITTDPTQFDKVKEAIEKLGFKPDHAAIEMVPKTMVEVDEETAKANHALIEWLEGIDDVDAVYHNMKEPG
jgi:YebC/PmpR family DNA-binding regulatory protein